MKKIRILSVLLAFSLALVDVAVGVETTKMRNMEKSTSKVPQTTNQQTQQAKPMMKIKSSVFLKLNVIVLTKDDIINYRGQIDSKYSSLKSGLYKLSNKYGTYNNRLNYCKKKSYTYEEQIDAGCSSNDTIQQCSEKLLVSCVGQSASSLKHQSVEVQNKIKDLINISDELAKKLNVLSKDLEQKYN